MTISSRFVAVLSDRPFLYLFIKNRKPGKHGIHCDHAFYSPLCGGSHLRIRKFVTTVPALVLSWNDLTIDCPNDAKRGITDDHHIRRGSALRRWGENVVKRRIKCLPEDVAVFITKMEMISGLLCYFQVIEVL
jgi:hypothetical protein